MYNLRSRLANVPTGSARSQLGVRVCAPPAVASQLTSSQALEILDETNTIPETVMSGPVGDFTVDDAIIDDDRELTMEAMPPVTLQEHEKIPLVLNTPTTTQIQTQQQKWNLSLAPNVLTDQGTFVALGARPKNFVSVVSGAGGDSGNEVFSSQMVEEFNTAFGDDDIMHSDAASTVDPSSVGVVVVDNARHARHFASDMKSAQHFASNVTGRNDFLSNVRGDQDFSSSEYVSNERTILLCPRLVEPFGSSMPNTSTVIACSGDDVSKSTVSKYPAEQLQTKQFAPARRAD